MTTLLKYLGLALARWAYYIFQGYLKPYFQAAWVWICAHPDRCLLLLISGLLIYLITQNTEGRAPSDASDGEPV